MQPNRIDSFYVAGYVFYAPRAGEARRTGCAGAWHPPHPPFQNPTRCSYNGGWCGVLDSSENWGGNDSETMTGEMFARPIQMGNRTSSLRNAVPGRRVLTAHAGVLKVPGAMHRTKPDQGRSHLALPLNICFSIHRQDYTKTPCCYDQKDILSLHPALPHLV